MTTVRDDGVVAELVARAGRGDQQAWDQLVERYAPLVWATCVRYRLYGSDADDVSATLWLRLVERLSTIREPAALPGWIASTTRNECLQLLRNRKRQVPVDTVELPDDESPASDEWLLAQERRIALRVAFRGLSERCRGLLSMLFADPPTPYAEIAAAVSIPVGSIGPTRGRCLDALRGSPAMMALAGQDG